MKEDIIDKLQSIINELNNNYCDDYADGVIDGLIIAIRTIKES